MRLSSRYFSFLQGYSTDLGKALVTHPLIRAVGFTGSLRAGRALFDLCAGRPEPVPFFGELGSTNPVFVLPAAGVARAAQIGTAWASSLTMGVGQFCTNPSVVFVQDGLVADAFVAAAKKVLSAVAAQTMLTTGMAESYRSASAAVQAHDKVQTIFAVPASNRQATPAIVTVSASDWLAAPELQHEIFGPFGIVVRVAGEDDLTKVAASLTGQLTCTLQMDAADHAIAARLLAILERKAGRILANGFPTGVEVANAMVHGGPYPASTNFGATSVGTMAIRRFLRPVCFQDMPLQLLPTF